jgi:hypothetical protein
MTYLIAIVAMLFALGDHWTTYLCLRAPVAGWNVMEANPIAAWAFERFGLAGGLWLDTAVTFVALVVLVQTPLIERQTKVIAMALLIATSGYAIDNNLEAVFRLGLSLTGNA